MKFKIFRALVKSMSYENRIDFNTYRLVINLIDQINLLSSEKEPVFNKTIDRNLSTLRFLKKNLKNLRLKQRIEDIIKENKQLNKTVTF